MGGLVNAIIFAIFKDFLRESSEYCLGNPELLDLFEATPVKILKNKRVLDVGCGDRFTVVLAAELGRRDFAFFAGDRFKELSLAQIREKVGLLKDFAKKKGELYAKSESYQINSVKIENFSEFLQPVIARKPQKKGTLSPKFEKTQETRKESEGSRIFREKSAKSLNFLESSQRLLSEINEFSQGDECQEPRVFTEPAQSLAISRERAEILQLLLKFNKDARIQQVSAENSCEKTLVAQQLFDEVAAEIVFKEENEPNFLPFAEFLGRKSAYLGESAEVSQKDAALVGNLAFVGEKHDALAHIREKLQVSQLNSLINSKNDVLKYQYIEMIRQGKEEELMNFLLSEQTPAFSWKTVEEAAKLLHKGKGKAHFRRKKLEDPCFLRKHEENLQNVHKALNSRAPRAILKKIGETLRNVERILGNSVDYYEKCKKNETTAGGASIFEDKELYLARKYKKIVENAALRDEKLKIAREARDRLEKSKEDAILQRIERKSIEFKKNLAKKRIEEELFLGKLRKMLVSLDVFLLIHLVSEVSRAGLEFKRKMFHFNMKARVLQGYFKKLCVFYFIF